MKPKYLRECFVNAQRRTAMEPDECNSAEDLTRLGWALGVYGSPSDFAREISEAEKAGYLRALEDVEAQFRSARTNPARRHGLR